MNGVTVYPHVTGGANTMRAPSVDVAALAAQIAALPVQTMTELAGALVAADAAQADRFADMLDAAYDAGIVNPVCAAQIEDLSSWSALDDDDIDYDYLPAMAQ